MLVRAAMLSATPHEPHGAFRRTGGNWLLLRGLGREQRHWHDFPYALADALSPARVHALDLVGVGTEHLRLPRPSIPWIARDVARRMSKLPVVQDEAWSLLGLSLGGMVALELCWLLQARVERAVIINASSALSPPLARLRARALPEMARALASSQASQRERIILGLTSSLSKESSAPYARSAARYAGDAPVRRLAVVTQLIAAARFRPPARASLPAHLLFLTSRQDALVSSCCTRDLAHFYAAPLEEHPTAGHDLTLDDPRWVCERVARFAPLVGVQE
jgi:pimeloyl-ACP methyl ester carboxylesterase